MADIDVEMLQQAFEELAYKIGEAVAQIVDSVYDLEDYQKYELTHPRKKPRGNIRRAKKNER